MTQQQIDAVAIPPPLRGFASGAPPARAFRLAWAAGRITQIEPVAGPPRGIAASAFVDLHVHIDKTYTVDEVGEAQGDLQTAIGKMQAARGRWTEAQVRARMTRALQDAWASGTRAMRTHLDWTGVEVPVALPVLREVREEWRGRIELQFVSLTALDLFDVDGAAQRRAGTLRQHGGILGAFVYRNEAAADKLRRVFELAARNDLLLDLHVDEGLHPDAQALSAVAHLTVEFGLQGRVTCGHACSLAIQPRAQAEETLARCAAAGIHLVALPTSNLYLQGDWSGTPVQRGITRVREARAAGVNVCVATDNVADAFYPYGSYDLLETWGLAVQMAHLPDAAAWLDAITTNPASAMGLAWDGRLRVGAPADLVVMPAASGYELVTPSGRQRQVYRDGAAVS
ncbi:amidohydrolase family protein [Ramlibacter sp. G-1-2-2]|uniref:Amidohydrolase family protein n=1 Tax=Ramlibacter agri TaxID=2728837 RepID=A0A848H4T8_9BURK|nr:amidohydrolase family protein [Ramlibacter agri]NML44529.1 amidohydrolase family protein [Ramlibacter agri]